MAAATKTARRDIVVVGSSAGGVYALPRLLRTLPADLPASVLICQHIAASPDPQLANILQRSTQLTVKFAEQGERIQKQHVYIAPPDVHLIVGETHLGLSRGPRENYVRPSIDRMFRSAAATHVSSTIAVILTGMMDDGVAGALAIKQAGGRVIVQEPHDAAFPELPQRALAALSPDATLPIDRIGIALGEMVREIAPPSSPSDDLVREAALDDQEYPPQLLDRLGEPTSVNCPECGGSLWALGSDQSRRWRCYLGHVVNASQLLERSHQDLEASLWNAVRTLHERAMTLETLANDARALGADRVASEYGTRALETRAQANLARQFMLDLLKRPA